jgi:hypothetical protein
MSRLAIAFVLVLAVASANAQNTNLMDECQVMASGGVRPPAIIVPTPALSLCLRKQVSLSANDKSAHPLPSSSARCPP